MGFHSSALILFHCILFHSYTLYFSVPLFCFSIMLYSNFRHSVLHHYVLFYFTIILLSTLLCSILLYSTLLHYCASTQTCANRRRRGSSHCRFSLCCWSWCLCCCTLRFRSWILVLSWLMTVTCRSVNIGILKFFCHPNSCDLIYLLEVPPAILS